MLHLCGLVVAAATVAMAASGTIASPQNPAVAWSAGVVRINGADHTGTGNLHPGAQLDTLRSASQLYLADGSRVRLGAATRIRIADHGIQLDAGAARIDAVAPAGNRLQVSAGELQVSAPGGIVQRPSANQIIVTAGTSASEVRKNDGILVARVLPGQTLTFAFQGNTPSSLETRLTGCVSKEENTYYIVDEVTNVKAELEGKDVAKLNGKRVQVRGKLVAGSKPDQSRLTIVNSQMTQGQACPVKPGEAVANATAAAATGAAAGGAAASGAAGAGGAAAGATAATVGAAGAVGAGLSTTAIVGIAVGVGGGLATTLGVVAANQATTISQ